MRVRLKSLWSFVFGLAFLPPVSMAQTYPTRPITLIVHSSAGGSIDMVNRLIADKVSSTLHQPLVLDFRPGGGSAIGAAAVARAQPDGYTIGFLGSAIPASQGLGKRLTFDARDFVPLGMFMNFRLGLAVSSSLGVRTLSELVTRAKENPEKLNYGSAGYGSSPHIAAVLFMQETGIKMTHVPYQSDTVAMQDLIAGRIDVYIGASSTEIPLHNAGQIRILAATGSRRAVGAPEVPTFRESGFEKAEFKTWGSWVFPPGTPPDLAQKVSTALLEATKDEEIRKRFEHVGVELVGVGPSELGVFIKAELSKYQDLSKSADIKLD